MMVADLVSADYRWLASPDSIETTCRLFKAGKTARVISQTRMYILTKYYPEDNHMLVFNNATTHYKRADNALSAKNMPKGTSKPGPTGVSPGDT